MITHTFHLPGTLSNVLRMLGDAWIRGDTRGYDYMVRELARLGHHG